MPLTVPHGGDRYLISTTFTLASGTTRVCQTGVLQIGSTMLTVIPDVAEAVRRGNAVTSTDRTPSCRSEAFRHAPTRQQTGDVLYAAFRTMPQGGNSYVSALPGSYLSRTPLGDATFVTSAPPKIAASPICPSNRIAR